MAPASTSVTMLLLVSRTTSYAGAQEGANAQVKHGRPRGTRTHNARIQSWTLPAELPASRLNCRTDRCL